MLIWKQAEILYSVVMDTRIFQSAGYRNSYMSKPVNYIPALRFPWLTPLFDPLLNWVMQEENFRRRLIRQANIQPDMQVLHLGCGTGTLTLMLKSAHPDVNVIGLDADVQVLDLAHVKAGSIDSRWDEGFAYSLPYPEAYFDKVVTSLVIHHLTRDEKRRTFREVFRVLKPQGEMHLLDFGTPHSILARLITSYMRHLEAVADHYDGLIPHFISEAGFRSRSEEERFLTIFGPLSLWRAIKGA